MARNECIAERVTRYINSGIGTKYTVTARHVEEWSGLAGSWIEQRLREDPDFERYGSGLARIPRELRAELKHGPLGYARLVGDEHGVWLRGICAYLAVREAAERECPDAAASAEHQTGALRAACAYWQECQTHSSRLRGGARVLTGVPHYFDASFITQYEYEARKDAQSLSLSRVLLDAVAGSEPRTSVEWRGHAVDQEVELAGRGLSSKPQDPMILTALQSGELKMPLWGVSLDRDKAKSFGERFLFLIDGPFHGVAAWRETGDQEDLQEIITGGRYEVLDTSDLPDRLGADSKVVVRLREVGTISSVPAQP